MKPNFKFQAKSPQLFLTSCIKLTCILKSDRDLITNRFNDIFMMWYSLRCPNSNAAYASYVFFIVFDHPKYC